MPPVRKSTSTHQQVRFEIYSGSPPQGQGPAMTRDRRAGSRQLAGKDPLQELYEAPDPRRLRMIPTLAPKPIASRRARARKLRVVAGAIAARKVKARLRVRLRKAAPRERAPKVIQRFVSDRLLKVGPRASRR